MSEATRDPVPELTQYESKLKDWGGWRANSGCVPSCLYPASVARIRPMPKPAASSAASTDAIFHLSKVTKTKKGGGEENSNLPLSLK